MDPNLASKERILEMYLDYCLGYCKVIRKNLVKKGGRTWQDFSRFALEGFVTRGRMGTRPRLTREERQIWTRWQEKVSKRHPELWAIYENDPEYKGLNARPWDFIRSLEGKYPGPPDTSWDLKAAMGAFEIVCLIAEEEDPRLKEG